MKTRGISLIVLVITILVLSILATTVIISLNNTNIIEQATKTVKDSNLKQLEEKLNVAVLSWRLSNPQGTLSNVSELAEHGFSESDVPEGYSVVITGDSAKIMSGWSGQIASSFSNGSGTEQDPYQISSGEELAYLAQITNNGNDSAGVYYVITEDINLNDLPWTPICVSYSNAFYGKLDGQNHTIYNIKVEGYQYAGLFGYVTSDSRGSVENITLCNGSISGTSSAGAFFANWYYEDNCCKTISNLTNINVAVNGDRAGGIAGGGDYVDFGNCKNTGSVTGTNRAAGIIGTTGIGCGAINSSNYGDITADIAAGILTKGEYVDANDLTNCVNYGLIRGRTTADPIVVGTADQVYASSTATNYGRVEVEAGGTITNMLNVNIPD